MRLKYVLLFILIFSTCCYAGINRYRIHGVGAGVNEGVNDGVNPVGETLFILDYSNSMNEFLLEKTKYEMLLESMKIILSKMSPDNKIGVRIYGHRWGFTPMDACRASNLIVPISSNNMYEIPYALSKHLPRGMTPITYSLKQAVKNDFKNSDSEKHIILITDGGENCDESPCKYAMELIKYRKDIRIDVIALNIDNDEDLEQLECTAVVTSGKLYQADTKAELVKSLNKAFRTRKNVDAKILY